MIQIYWKGTRIMASDRPTDKDLQEKALYDIMQFLPVIIYSNPIQFYNIKFSTIKQIKTYKILQNTEENIYPYSCKRLIFNKMIKNIKVYCIHC